MALQSSVDISKLSLNTFLIGYGRIRPLGGGSPAAGAYPRNASIGCSRAALSDGYSPAKSPTPTAKPAEMRMPKLETGSACRALCAEIFVQFLVESVSLSVAGALLGLGLGVLAIQSIAGFFPKRSAASRRSQLRRSLTSARIRHTDSGRV